MGKRAKREHVDQAGKQRIDWFGLGDNRRYVSKAFAPEKKNQSRRPQVVCAPRRPRKTC